MQGITLHELREVKSWYNNRKDFPVIKLSGQKLTWSGFKVGDKIKIEFDDKKITIEKED